MTSCGGIFDIDHAKEEIERINAESHEPGFWDDSDKAQAKMREKGNYQTIVETLAAQERRLDDAEVLIAMGKEGCPSSMRLRRELSASKCGAC